MSDDVCTNLSQGPEKSSYFPNVAGNFLTISSKTGLIFFSEHRSVDLLWQMQVFMHLV